MSRETRYTPGGWFLSSAGTDVLEVSGGVIAKLLVPDGCAAQRAYREAQMAANAHLIAAAPDLLEALEIAIQWAPLEPTSCQGLKCGDPWCCWCHDEESARAAIDAVHADLPICRTAIAKAYGEGQ